MPSCAAYHPMKIDPQATDAALKLPDLEKLRIEAQTLDHPILKPMVIDLQNGLSPDEAAVLAVYANPTLRGSRDQKNIAHAELIEAGILPNPQLSASYDVPTAGSTAGTINAYGFGLGWDFMSLITRKDRISAAQSDEAAVDLTVAWQEWQVAESAKLNVLHLLWGDQTIALLRSAKGDFARNLGVVRKAVEMGEKTAVELAAAQSASRQMEMDLSDAEQEREQARLALNQILGLPPDAVLVIENEVPISGWPAVPENEDFVSGLPQRRPDLMALNLGYESQEAKLRGAVLSQFPRIGIDVNQARDTSNVITTGLGVSIEFPFFDRGQGRIAIETATRQKLYDEYMDRIFEARAELSAVMEKIKSGRKRIETAEKSVDSLQSLVNTYKTALDQGNADILSYYQAQQDLMANRLELLKLRQSVSDLGVAFETAAGMYFPIKSGKEHEGGGEQ